MLFVLPAFTVYAVFVVIPVIQAIYYSGFKWNGLKPLTDFVGLANYERALSDPVKAGDNTFEPVVTVSVGSRPWRIAQAAWR